MLTKPAALRPGPRGVLCPLRGLSLGPYCAIPRNHCPATADGHGERGHRGGKPACQAAAATTVQT